MPPIVPRWEWRAFAARFGDVETRLAEKLQDPPHESDELYFLAKGGENVKVRDALMDVKVLREIDSDGLQQWIPVMKTEFPLPAAEVEKVLQALKIAAPIQRQSYSLSDFTTDFAGPHGPIRSVKVHKQRRRFTIGKCMAELSDVVANDQPARTIAIEHEDPAAVIDAVRELHLDGWVNTSYPKGIAAIVDGVPERYAIIDSGTNSIKFHVAELGRNGKLRTLVDRAEVTRLGEGLEMDGRIAPAAVSRAATAISAMAAEAQKHAVLALVAVGTAGLRIAKNREEVLAAIRDQTGVAIEVIPGEEEARLAYLGVQSGLDLGTGSLVVVDTGGGSSQFTFGQGTHVDEQFSVDVGAVRYTERFGLADAVTPEVLEQVFKAIASDLSRIRGRPKPDKLVGMGGAVTNLTAVKHRLATYDASVVQGSVIERAEIERQIELYRSRDADGRRGITGLQPKRAEVILAGACIVRTILDLLGQDRFTVSDRGLRHGVLAERFGT